jgi:hypothetical protein
MSFHVIEWVLEHSPVEHRGDLLVLLVLASYAHEDGTRAFPSVDNIGRKARLSRRGVQGALRRLTDAGAIEQTAPSHPGKARTYRVLMGEHGAPMTDPMGAVSDVYGRSQRPLWAQGTAPYPLGPVINPSSLTSLGAVTAPTADGAEEGEGKDSLNDKSTAADKGDDVDPAALRPLKRMP